VIKKKVRESAKKEAAVTLVLSKIERKRRSKTIVRRQAKTYWAHLLLIIIVKYFLKKVSQSKFAWSLKMVPPKFSILFHIYYIFLLLFRWT